jgi:hypothetical protein
MNERILMELPMFKKLSTDVAEPWRLKLRMLKLLPREAKSKAEKLEPIFDTPKTEQPDPYRWKERKDKELPKWQ